MNNHKENCIIVNGEQATEMIEPNTYIRFKNYHNQLQVPFVIHADFEAIQKCLCKMLHEVKYIKNTVKNSSHSKRKNDGSSASSASGSTISAGDSSDDNFLQSHTPKQTQGKDSLSYLEKCKPLDLPADFDLLTTFGKRVDKAVKTDFKQPGSLPHDLTKKVVSQVTDHIESENPRPSKQTIERLAWR